MSAAPAAITTAAQLAVIGTPRQDETWWAAEAARTGPIVGRGRRRA